MKLRTGEVSDCYLCHGEKIIPIKHDGKEKGLGCPACKRRGDVIGEGFIPTMSPGLQRLSADMVDDWRQVVARRIAREIGAVYNGYWPGAGYTFTDNETGGTFMVADLRETWPRCKELRQEFEEEK